MKEAKKRKVIDCGVIDRGWEYHPNHRLEGLLQASKYLKWKNLNKETKKEGNKVDYKKVFEEVYLKESMESLNELLKTLPRYNRPTCINCNDKLVCIGECEQTIK